MLRYSSLFFSRSHNIQFERSKHFFYYCRYTLVILNNHNILLGKSISPHQYSLSFSHIYTIFSQATIQGFEAKGFCEEETEAMLKECRYRP